MGLIQAPYAPILPFRRPTENADGNTTFTDIGDFPAAVNLTGPGLATGTGTRYGQAGEVFVPRGSDVIMGDQFAYNGDQYTIASKARGDQAQIFTGDDFGWVGYDCMAATVRWGS